MSVERKSQQVYEKQGKTLPLVIEWGDRSIYLGVVQFLGDDSFIFKVGSHNSKNADLPVELGSSVMLDGSFINRPPETLQAIGRGLHISLHPPTQSQQGVMHFRENAPGPVLSRRYIEWFPVTTPFRLLHFFTLPLDTYSHSTKTVTIINSIESSYKDSLEIIFDIFPRDTEKAHPYIDSFEIWGTSPSYRVRISIVQSGSRTPEIIYWPVDNKLEL